MVERARKAQVIYDERFDQERVDQVIKVAARTIFDHANPNGCLRRQSSQKQE